MVELHQPPALIYSVILKAKKENCVMCICSVISYTPNDKAIKYKYWFLKDNNIANDMDVFSYIKEEDYEIIKIKCFVCRFNWPLHDRL